jgi:beta-lactam-binding protein with PASTA domain
MARDTGGNVAVDYVWGNMPMQPDDDRGLNTLDPALDNHVIASVNWNGFPDYTPVVPFLDTIANVVVPDIVGETTGDAQTAVEAVDLVYASTTTTVGGTSVNADTVKTQAPAADAVVNSGSTVTAVLYAQPAVPDLFGMTEAEATAAIEAAGFVAGTPTTTDVGATAENDGLVESQTPVAAALADYGSTVDFVLYAFGG